MAHGPSISAIHLHWLLLAHSGKGSLIREGSAWLRANHNNSLHYVIQLTMMNGWQRNGQRQYERSRAVSSNGEWRLIVNGCRRHPSIQHHRWGRMFVMPGAEYISNCLCPLRKRNSMAPKSRLSSFLCSMNSCLRAHQQCAAMSGSVVLPTWRKPQNCPELPTSVRTLP